MLDMQWLPHLCAVSLTKSAQRCNTKLQNSCSELHTLPAGLSAARLPEAITTSSTVNISPDKWASTLAPRWT